MIISDRAKWDILSRIFIPVRTHEILPFKVLENV